MQGALAQRVEVGQKELRIRGSKSVLLRTLVAAESAKTAGFGVPSSVILWRARPSPSEGIGPRLQDQFVLAHSTRR
jgi:hypothetical protein